MRFALFIIILFSSSIAFSAPRVVMVESQQTPQKPALKGLGGSEIDDMAQEIMRQEGSKPQKLPAPLLQPTATHSAPSLAKKTPVQRQTIRLEILQIAPLVQGEPLVVKFRLKAFRERRFLTFGDLKEVHAHKIHVLMTDQTLTDYHHLHPIPDPTDPEIFTYTITPRKSGAYRVWVDITLNNGTQEILSSYIRGNARTEGLIDRSIVMLATVSDMKATLNFNPSSLVLGETSTGRVDITDTKGNALTDLEPIMGTFGHIVAISEDRKTLAHIHPLGDEPTKPEQRGTSPLSFHLQPKANGITKVFLQVRRGGTDYTFPFSINIK